MICDRERQYAQNLLQMFSGKREAGMQLYLFYTLEELRRFAGEKKVHILLIAGEYSQKQRESIPAEARYVLTKEKRRLPQGETGIYRYQSADAIWAQIAEAQESKRKAMALPASITGELIGVYSPIHRIGKTQFALEMGKQLAQKEPTLYLNLEGYSGQSHYFSEMPEQHLGDLLYYSRQEKGSLGLRVSAMAGQMDHLDYIYPMPFIQDFKTITGAEWLELLERILAECVYRRVILDLGDGVDGLFDILQRCDSVYTPYIEEAAARAKLAQYTENLRRTGLEAVLEKTIQKRMPVKKNGKQE